MKKKISIILLIIFIVSISTCGLVGCTGISYASPVDNTELIKRIGTVVWDEGAKKYDNWTRDNPGITVEELATGTKPARYSTIQIECASNKFDGYEFYNAELDIMADRDVKILLVISYGVSVESNIRISKELNLKANEKQSLDLDFDNNFIMANGDSNPTIYLKIKGEPASDSIEFREWSQIQYTISNFKLFALEPKQ